MSHFSEWPQRASSLHELPLPDADAQAHSLRVLEQLRAEIDAAGGALAFSRAMDLLLHAPGLGYYSAGARKLGAEGDFVTAPEISPLFSRTLARQCAELLREIPAGELLEFGAGSGAMAADMLLELEALGALPPRYAILEISADLRARQRQTLLERAPRLLDRVVWLERLPEQFSGVMLANEVLDAMPVQRFRWRDGAVIELGVGWENGALVWRALPDCSPRLRRRVQALAAEHGWSGVYESEVNLAAEDWLGALAGALHAGVLLLFDYGFPAYEYYHPQRAGGTLMCHYRHRAHADPLILPGLQDITAHVNFSAVAQAGADAGLDVLGFANQANFLIGGGLLELAAEAGDLRAQLEIAAQLKRLLMPGEMGELFKVLALGRGLAEAGSAFALRDDRHRL